MANEQELSNKQKLELRKKITTEFVRSFLSMGWISAIADVFVSSLVLYLSWSAGVSLPLLICFAAIQLLNLQLFRSYLSYRKTDSQTQEQHYWYGRVRRMALMHGASWGVFSSLAFFSMDSTGFIYMTLILLTITISSLPVLSQLFLLFAIRVLLMLTPTIVLAHVSHRFDIDQTILVFLIVFPLLLIVLGYFRCQNLRRSTALHLRNELTLAALNMEISQRKKMEEELRHAVKRAELADAAKSRFLANISHEIRTPLTAIRGLCERILRVGKLDSESRQQLDVIHRSSEHLSRIIDDVLDMAQVEAGKLHVKKEDCQIIEIIQDVCANFEKLCEEKGIDFQLSYQFPVPLIAQTDATRVRQIIFNLLNNALKFTDTGCIAVTLEFDSAKQKLGIHVSDTGIGLSQEEQQQIFKAFTQARPDTTPEASGTGLGLTIARELARKLGGDLTVQSQPNIGSRFSLRIACGDISNQHLCYSLMQLTQPTQDIKTKLPSFSGRVLLAEDSKFLQLLIGNMLEDAGINFDCVGNGREAVKQALAENYDLILMDMHMPDMNGIEATSTLRQQAYTKAIVALSANVDKKDYDAYWQAGINDFLQKPIDTETFYTTLKKYLKTAKQAPEDIYESLRGKFKENLAKSMRNIHAALERGDHDTAYLAAHDLKGQSRAYQLSEIGELADSLQRYAQGKQDDKARAVFHQLRQACEEFIEQ